MIISLKNYVTIVTVNISIESLNLRHKIYQTTDLLKDLRFRYYRDKLNFENVIQKNYLIWWFSDFKKRIKTHQNKKQQPKIHCITMVNQHHHFIN